jgi:hypothetical protein
MIQIDLPMAAGMGSFFAAAASRQLKGGSRLQYYRILTINLLFQIMFILWLPIYLFVAAFGWETSHMWFHKDSLADYPALLPLFVLAYVVLNVAGYHYGTILVRRGETRKAWMIFYAACAFFVGWIALQPHRTLRLGTYQEWLAGGTPYVWQDKALFAVVMFGAISFNIALIVVYRYLKKDGAAMTNEAG